MWRDRTETVPQTRTESVLQTQKDNSVFTTALALNVLSYSISLYAYVYSYACSQSCGIPSSIYTMHKSNLRSALEPQNLQVKFEGVVDFILVVVFFDRFTQKKVPFLTRICTGTFISEIQSEVMSENL